MHRRVLLKSIDIRNCGEMNFQATALLVICEFTEPVFEAICMRRSHLLRFDSSSTTYVQHSLLSRFEAPNMVRLFWMFLNVTKFKSGSLPLSERAGIYRSEEVKPLIEILFQHDIRTFFVLLFLFFRKIN